MRQIVFTTISKKQKEKYLLMGSYEYKKSIVSGIFKVIDNIDLEKTFRKVVRSKILSDNIYVMKFFHESDETFTVSKNYINWNNIDFSGYQILDHVSFVFEGRLNSVIHTEDINNNIKSESYVLNEWDDMTYVDSMFYDKNTLDFHINFTSTMVPSSHYCIFRRDSLDFSRPQEKDLGPIFRKRKTISAGLFTIPKGYMVFSKDKRNYEVGEDFLYNPFEDFEYNFDYDTEILLVKIDDEESDYE